MRKRNAMADIDLLPAPGTVGYLVAEMDVGLSVADMTLILNTFGEKNWDLVNAYPRGHVPGAKHVAIFSKSGPSPEPPTQPPLTWQSSGVLTAGAHQVSTGKGFVGKLIIQVSGSSGAWRVWDAMPASLVWAADYDDPKVQSSAIVALDFPVTNGIFIEVPPDGECLISWGS
jgi:hypothetical protein